MKRFGLLALAALLAAFAATAGQSSHLAVEADQVLVTYQVALGPKQLAGVSRGLAGGVDEQPGGGLKIHLSVPVSSFESGTPGVDALFARTLEARKYPDVVFEGESPASRKTGQFTVNVIGTLTVHGVAQRVAVPVKVLRDGKTIFVKAAFPVELGAHGVAAPSIGGASVSSRVQIEVHALLRPSVTPQG